MKHGKKSVSRAIFMKPIGKEILYSYEDFWENSHEFSVASFLLTFHHFIRIIVFNLAGWKIRIFFTKGCTSTCT